MGRTGRGAKMGRTGQGAKVGRTGRGAKVGRTGYCKCLVTFILVSNSCRDLGIENSS